MKELKNFVMVSSLLFTLSVCSSADKKNDAPPAKPSAKDTPVSRTEPSSPQPEPAAFSPEKTAPAPAKPATRENNNSLGLVGVSSGIDSSTIVPNAKPGQCFSKVIIPADYKEVVEQYIKKPASERTETVPPQYELIQEKILVRPATVRYEEIPAVYEVVEEKVLVKPASKKVIELPPVYETVEERVVDKEGYTVWKKSEDSNLLCLIEVPPVYKTIQKQVLKVPASKTEEVVPEEYSIIKRQIEKIVNKVGGCIVWGGHLGIAPADDIIIRVEEPLAFESFDKIIISIMAKKVAAGTNHLVLDIPVGKTMKIRHFSDAEKV
ncbi:MAG TPA: hypothetical protein PL048_13800, partial [Leptospiraceae bacterium]|nr:hypothetical protein [Leptospiraceae bacterium]